MTSQSPFFLNQSPFANTDVLLMEPSAFLRGMVRNILHELGVRRIRETTNAQEAISTFKGQAADLVITHWADDMDSLWLIKSLRCLRDSPFPYVPIVAMSAYTEVHTVCEARDQGIDWFVAKPLSAKTLESHMRAAVVRRRPFIAETAYFGPDRRHLTDNSAFMGRNRRTGIAAVAAA